MVEFSRIVQEHSVQDPTRDSTGDGGSMGYRLFRRRPIFGLCVWGLGLWVCGSVLGVWDYGFVVLCLCHWGVVALTRWV